MSERLVYVELPYATYGLVVEDGQVVDAPPIAHWMVGKSEHEVAAWIARKGGRGTPLPPAAATAPIRGRDVS